MLWYLLLAILLFATSGILIVIEIFVPSFGLLTLFSILSLSGGLLLIRNSTSLGIWTGVILAGLIIPLVLWITYKLFPKTPIGKAIHLKAPIVPLGEGISKAQTNKNLIGKKGQVVSKLRPIGICNIEGKRIECISEAGFIEKDVDVLVIDFKGASLLVRKIN